MRGILLLLPGDRGRLPEARELREAGFTLSTALAPAGGERGREPERDAVRDAVRARGLGGDEQRKALPPGPGFRGEGA